MIENTNVNLVSINTDQAISDILANFNDDYIESIITDSFEYKFRPYNTRMPNLPAMLHDKFTGIYDNYVGDAKDMIRTKELDIWQLIINTICVNYNLKIATDIPDEQLYTMAYLLYQIFISEFTDRMISFFAYYIINNITSIVNAMSEEQKAIKTAYAKKLYSGNTIAPVTLQNYTIVYDNMGSVLDMIVMQDIPMPQLIEALSDSQISQFVNSYLIDCGDLYKNSYATYIKNPQTIADMISCIKLKMIDITTANVNQFAGEYNPYIVKN